MPLSSTHPHALAPMLTPRSIALIGASRKRNSVGNDVLCNLLASGFGGNLYPVNPSYPSLYGRACHEAIEALPEAVDLAILAVPNKALQRCVDQALAAGAGSLLIFASAELPDDGRRRIAAMARAARVPLCGANCMGFYNAAHALPAFSARFPQPLEPGGITCIAQSGSLLQALLFNDQRLQFNLAVSTGQELVSTTADFMDYALDQTATRLIVLVLEGVRDPKNFVAALAKAQRRGVPIVALKLARTGAAAQMALSHTGAIAGDAAVYEALFHRYGVISVRDPSELAATATLLTASRRATTGGLAAILDSGGERELLVDAAADIGVPFARIDARTMQLLREQLDPGLEAANPLDAWGTGREFEQVFETCLGALMRDADTALGMLVCDLSDELDLHEAYAGVCEAAAQATDKLLVVMSNYSAWSHRRLALRLTRAGIPVLDGTHASLRAVAHALAYRDFLAGRSCTERELAPANPRAAYWRSLLMARTAPLTEDQCYALLADYGIQVPQHVIAEDADSVAAAGRAIGFPVALKTAMPGILHKSEVGGVRLGLSDTGELAEAYAQISASLGARVLVSAMVPAGVEIAFGLLQDAAFGAFVMVAFGGTWIEYLHDRKLAMVPLAAAAAAQLISQLRMAKVLQGVRGAAACDQQALVHVFVQLSQLAHELGSCITEMDLNPVIVSSTGAVAVDCLIVPGCLAQPEQQHAL
jgi:acetate---CoA ligase (ADP-forming)